MDPSVARRKEIELAARKNAAPKSVAPKAAADAADTKADELPSFDDVDFSVDPDAVPAKAAAVEVPEAKPAKPGSRVKWRLLSNVCFDGETTTKAGTVLDLTDAEATHLRKQGACEPVV